MICEKCREEDLKSSIRSRGCSRTLLSCSPYYDEAGVYHSHDYNTSSCGYECSNGHRFTIHSKLSCPSCDFGGDKKIVYHE